MNINTTYNHFKYGLTVELPKQTSKAQKAALRALNRLSESICQATKTFIHKTRRFASLMSYEMTALFKTSVTYPLFFINMNSPKAKLDNPDTTYPVIFVHGYLSNSSCFRPIRSKIQKDPTLKNHPLYFLNLPTTFQSIRKSAINLKYKIKKIQKITGCKKVILVGHSMGGIIASEYTQNHNNKNNVKEVITVSSPVRGTKTSRFALGKSPKQMGRGCQFIESLYKSSSQSPKAKYFNIGNNADWVIRPCTSTIGDEPEDPNNNVYFDNIGHLGVLHHSKVANKIIERIKNAHPITLN